MNRKDFTTDISAGERTFTAMITNSAVDRMNEVLLPEGMDVSEFKKNPVVFWNHDYDKPIGKGTKLTKTADGWLAAAQIGSTPFAQEIHTLMKEGIVRGVSVGFRTTEERSPTKQDKAKFGDGVRNIISKWKLMEFSVTPMPCNQEALIQSVKAGRFSVERAKSLLGAEVEIEQPKPQRRKVYVIVPDIPKPEPVFDVGRAVHEAVAKMMGRPFA